MEWRRDDDIDQSTDSNKASPTNTLLQQNIIPLLNGVNSCIKLGGEAT